MELPFILYNFTPKNILGIFIYTVFIMNFVISYTHKHSCTCTHACVDMYTHTLTLALTYENIYRAQFDSRSPVPSIQTWHDSLWNTEGSTDQAGMGSCEQTTGLGAAHTHLNHAPLPALTIHHSSPPSLFPWGTRCVLDHSCCQLVNPPLALTIHDSSPTSLPFHGVPGDHTPPLPSLPFHGAPGVC